MLFSGRDQGVKDIAENTDEMLKEKLKEAEKQLLQLQAEKERMLLHQKAGDMLTKRGLSKDMAAYLVGSDAEDTEQRVGAFEKMMRRMVESEVKERIKGFSPLAGATANVGISGEDFRRMTYRERVKLRQDMPEVYDQLRRSSK